MTHLLQNPVVSEKPLYEHDCTHCEFLGTYSVGPKRADLYVHTLGERTVIARYSDDGPDYSSGLCFSYGQIPVLTEARHRAEARGLLDYSVYEALHYTPEDSPEYAVLCKALPFTLEYQACLAFREGRIDRSRGLVVHLLQIEKAKPYHENHTEGACLVDLESRMHQVLGVMQKDKSRALYGQVELVTRFLWEAIVAADA